MKDFAYPTPRALFGVCAVALTALTLGLFAVLPTQTGPSARLHEIAIVTPAAAQAPTDPSPAVRYIAPIEVVATRAPKVISAQEREAPAKRGDQG